MAKVKLKYCRKCGRYTEFIYLGKEPITGEEIREKIEEAVFTFGIFPILDFLCGTDSRPTFRKCTRCGEIYEC